MGLTPWAVGAAVMRIIPDAQMICGKIELGKKVISFIGEVPEWVNYNQNLESEIESMKNMMRELLCVKEDVYQELQIQEFRNNKKRKREVAEWMRNVRRCTEEATQVERDMGQKGALSRFLFRAWLGSCVEKKKNEIRILLDHKRAFEHQLVIDAHRFGQEKLVPVELVGQAAAQKAEEIWELLAKPDVTILGVEGDQWIGKSTIIMHIHDRILDEPCLFDCAFYFSIKEENDVEVMVKNLQTRIGKELKLQDLEEEDDVMKRAARINNALSSFKRFVLILDGLTSHFDLCKVGIPVKMNGCKLFVVSQWKRVCQRMSCQRVVRVNALPFEDAKKLFMKSLDPSSDLSAEIEECADKIIRRCNGVPKRIIEASTSLRNVNEISTWNTTLSELYVPN